MLSLCKLIMTYLQTVMFVIQRNTISKLAKHKRSAEYSLRKAGLENVSFEKSFALISGCSKAAAMVYFRW